jgi:hypothetical protein
VAKWTILAFVRYQSPLCNQIQQNLAIRDSFCDIRSVSRSSLTFDINIYVIKLFHFIRVYLQGTCAMVILVVILVVILLLRERRKFICQSC